MRKYSKTFHANEGYKLTIFIGTLFKRYMYLANPYFLYENVNIVVNIVMRHETNGSAFSS